MKPDMWSFLRRGIQQFSRLSYRGGVSTCVALILVVTYIDYVTGVDASPILLYLVPIALGSWFLHPGDGERLAVLSAMLFTAADLMELAHNPRPIVHIWNGVSAFALFYLFSRVIEDLRKHVDTQNSLARVDFLTGIGNRRAFDEVLESESLRAKRWQTPLAVAYLDIDRFKAVNDSMGHEKGDLLLRQTATLLKNNLRATDTVARLGGDEFAFLLVGSEAHVVRKIVEKIHYGLHGMANANDWPVSFSIGVVTYMSAPVNAADMLRAADELMYAVKRDRGGSVRYRVVDRRRESRPYEAARY